jgi:hypothetical protein
VDGGDGWLIFALPPGEAAFQPPGENGLHELCFMCDGFKAEMASLAKKGIKREHDSCAFVIISERAETWT